MCVSLSVPSLYIYKGHADRETVQRLDIGRNLGIRSIPAGRRLLSQIVSMLLCSLCLGVPFNSLGNGFLALQESASRT